MITDQQVESAFDALEIAKKAKAASDCELYEQAMDFYYREMSLITAINVGLEEANKAAEEEDWDTWRNCMENVYFLMPVTLARTWEISSVSQAKFILETLHDGHYRKDVDIAHKGSAANLLATKALEYIAENGSREEWLAIMKGAYPQLYEIVTSPLGITDDGFKVIDVEDCAKALGIPLDELIEMSPDNAFLPEGTKVNPIH